MCNHPTKLWANPSLGDTTTNVTPQIFLTHSTLGQHMIHLKKAFHSEFHIKRLPSCVEFKTSIGFTKKLILIFQMNAT
jgi:hypothetical protein